MSNEQMVALLAAIFRLNDTVRFQGNLVRMEIAKDSWDADTQTDEDCIAEARKFLRLASSPPPDTGESR